MSHRLRFSKMHGAGNDFVMVLDEDLPAGGLDGREIAALCDRRRGIGADGLICVSPAADADFTMSYYNADGGEAEMCGNGARCAVAFAHAAGLAPARCEFTTAAGRVVGQLLAPGSVEVALTGWRDVALDLSLPGSPFSAHHVCHTGVPHLVIPVDDVDAVDVMGTGPALRRRPELGRAGANVNWVDAGGEDGAWRLRTYERGVEAETLACGTGAAAAAVVLCALGVAASPVALQTRGRDLLKVTVDHDNQRLHLQGPAVLAFRGEVEV